MYSSASTVAPAERAHALCAEHIFQEDPERICVHISVVTVAPTDMRATCAPKRALGGTMAHENLRDIFFIFLLVSL